jgi:hypothetical protein
MVHIAVPAKTSTPQERTQLNTRAMMVPEHTACSSCLCVQQLHKPNLSGQQTTGSLRMQLQLNNRCMLCAAYTKHTTAEDSRPSMYGTVKPRHEHHFMTVQRNCSIS